MEARQYHHQLVHFCRKGITYADDGSSVLVGKLPAGACMVGPMCGMAVTTAFDGSTTINIGDASTAAKYASALVTTALGFVPFDVAASPLVAEDTNIYAAVAGTSPTAGAAEIILCYIPDTDG